MVASPSAWFTPTVMPVACTVTLLPKPTKPTKPALACSVVHLRAGVVLPEATCSVSMARPKFTPVIDRPSWLAVPPLMPAKAVKLLPPTLSRSTLTVSAVFCPVCLASFTAAVLLSIAKSPSTWKKPYTFSTKWPLARFISPLAPSIVSAIVLVVPVAMRITVLRALLALAGSLRP